MKYLKGYFKSLHPILPAKFENNTLVIGKGNLEIKIDTGFDGNLSIPLEYLNLLSYKEIGTVSVTDYKNRSWTEEFFETKVNINGTEKDCDFLVGDFLIGMEFLNESFEYININFQKNRIRLKFK